MLPWEKRKKQTREIQPDEILADSSNIPEFDRDQFEGRLERPLGKRSFTAAGVMVTLILFGLLFRAGELQIARGETYAEQALNNQLEQKTVFADRGILVDRNGEPLAWNERGAVTDDFAVRTYTTLKGLSHVIGYVRPPAKDSSGFYYRNAFTGMDGAERAYDKELGGQNGLKLSETDAKGAVVSESTVQPPIAGEKITLSIDAKVTEGLYKAIAAKVQQSNFQGGAGVVVDVETGEILAMTSYPEYSPTALTSGDSPAIKAIFADKNQPFLNRVTDGVYAPGSIVKPVVAAAAITEGVITPEKQILSTGSISIPNPNDPKKSTVFKDWRVNGWTDARRAIAVSSDIYFYEVGGGFQGQPGLGIAKLDKYFSMFGFGKETGLAGFSDKPGNIPTPEWKQKNFPDDPTWRIGNTYHTAIGQYGMLVTPLQAVMQAAAIANNGKLLSPTLIASTTPKFAKVDISPEVLQIVREGMRMGVVDGIAQAVKFDYVHVAAKTGTAQVGMRNENLNSWMIGFFPYEKPRYAYAIVLEKGPAGTLVGASAAVSDFLQWMHTNTPQYFAIQP